MRVLPNVSPPEAVPKASGINLIRPLDIKVITPMFGGSDKPGVVDPERPVTAKEIRGHLRFWWRACVAARYATAEELFAAEAEIWGGVNVPEGKERVAKASAVDLTVSDWRGFQVVPYSRLVDHVPYVTNRRGERRPVDSVAYTVFPFQETDPQPAFIADGASFRLSVAFRGANAADIRREVEQAITAWILFGGIGARTRRGLGSLQTDSVQAAKLIANGQALANVLGVVGTNRVPLVPCLKGARILRGEAVNHKDAWAEAAKLMQQFRQGASWGRTGLFGRSKWPEADTIRDVAGVNKRTHVPNHAARPFYPRADLGLPIVFHFKDSPARSSPWNDLPGFDPVDRTLQGATDDQARMASPFIAKAVAVSSTQSVPVVLWLDSARAYDSHGPGVVLRRHDATVEARLSRADVIDPAKTAAVDPLGGIDDVREAFWDYARAHLSGAEEVILP